MKFESAVLISSLVPTDFLRVSVDFPEEVRLREHGYSMQRWRVGLPDMSMFDFLARIMHRHAIWCITRRCRAFSKNHQACSTGVWSVAGSQELAVCSQTQNKPKQRFLEVLVLLFRRAALPWTKPSGWVRFAICNGLVPMYSVKVFDVTISRVVVWYPRLYYLYMLTRSRRSFC